MGCRTLCRNLFSCCPICRNRGTKCLICECIASYPWYIHYPTNLALIIFLNLPGNTCFYLYRCLRVTFFRCITICGGKYFFCRAYIVLFFLVKRESAKDSDPQIEPSDYQEVKIQYVGCDAGALIHGVQINTVIEYFLRKIGLKQLNGTDPEDSYKKYCEALRKNLHGSEPYGRTIKIGMIQKDNIINQMRGLLPDNRPIQFEPLIAEVSTNVVAHYQHRKHKPLLRESKVTSFVVLKVSKYGENLEITPCYMVVSQKWSNRESLYSMEYKQEKFILSKFDIENICPECTETDNEANTPLYYQPALCYDSTSNYS